MQKENKMIDVVNKNDKASGGITYRLEESLKSFLVPKVAKFLRGPFSVSLLTWASALWSVLMVASFYLGAYSEKYLYIFFPVILLQYITDTLDGAVGRHNKTGLIRWGYYTDHFFDFVFLTSIVTGYGILFGFDIWLFLIYSALCGFMISVFLSVSAEEDFGVTFFGIGPTEGRIIVSAFHFLVIYFGFSYIHSAFPYVSVLSWVILIFVFIKKQNLLWFRDMSFKNQ